MTVPKEDLLASASGFAPDAKASLTASELIKPKKFETTFKSPAWPEYDGQVVIRYPSLGDMLQIESMSGGKGANWELWATLRTCVEKAPATWYHLVEGQKEPALALDQIQDSEGLWEMWVEYLTWRRSFRRPRK
jgi:hypothetical protein